MTRILVTGVRGKTGVPLAELLVTRSGVEVLGGSSSPATVAIGGVRPTEFSWDDPSGWPAATDGVDAVYVVRLDRADSPDLIGPLLDVTPPQTYVVLLSEQNADHVPTDGWAARAEAAVRSSGRSLDDPAAQLVHAGFHRPPLLPRQDRERRAAAVPERWREGGLDRRPGHRRSG